MMSFVNKLRLRRRPREQPWPSVEEFRKAVAKELGELIRATRYLLEGAENYLEIAYQCEVTGDKFAIRVQRVGKITPHAARLYAEARRMAAVELMAEAIPMIEKFVVEERFATTRNAMTERELFNCEQWLRDAARIAKEEPLPVREEAG